MNLDTKNREYILNKRSIYKNVSKISKLKDLPFADKYLEIVDYFKNEFTKQSSIHKSFPSLSHNAWKYPFGDEKTWVYSPGRDAIYWDEFYTQGIMAIGWDKLQNLEGYSSKNQIKEKMKKIYGADQSYVNDALATWEFAKEMSIGDIVYVKKGKSTILGYGIVKSEYIYNDNRKKYPHIRKVEWKAKGEWDNPRKEVNKTLTEITSSTEEIRKLQNLFINTIYTKTDFLSEVFMDESSYDRLIKILKIKKNLIIQGAPGVGKTFVSKRLAYSLMGKKDESRVEMVQFHQNYAYEDLIMGFRPLEGEGFGLEYGVFYDFCKRAAENPEKSYYFIIDEINRGNLSKIFGELFMLIENDKRDEFVTMGYSKEKLSVPSNIYIIGTMNTADRSLAQLEVAMRRRFAFINLIPEFNMKWESHLRNQGVSEKMINKISSTIKRINEDISNDFQLGKGYEIGHSFFTKLPDHIDEDRWFEQVMRYEIKPLLEEYYFDRLEIPKRLLEGI